MNKNILEFLNILLSHPELCENFKNFKTREEYYNYVISICDGYTLKEFDELMNKVIQLKDKLSIKKIRTTGLE